MHKTIRNWLVFLGSFILFAVWFQLYGSGQEVDYGHRMYLWVGIGLLCANWVFGVSIYRWRKALDKKTRT